MSEVKRYNMSGYGDGMIEVPDGAFVYLEDHQSELAALREENERLKSESFEELYNAAIDELDALREELASYKNNYVTKMAYNAVQSSLTAAEQRNAELTKAIEDAEYRTDQGKVWNGMGWTYTGLHSHGQQKVLDILRATLKPTESGASE